MSGSTNNFKSWNSESGLSAGIVVDAGPALGYGHAVRCLRLARALGPEVKITFYAMSEECAAFLRSNNPKSDVRVSASEFGSFPQLVITDLREAHGITAAIRRQSARHISIHDLGLAQCRSNVAIDGSVTRLFPFAVDEDRSLFLGPQYMITRETVVRGASAENTVLITLGGGSTAIFAEKLARNLSTVGLKPVITRGFASPSGRGQSGALGEGLGPLPEGEANQFISSDREFSRAIASCRFAISGSGVTLYDLLASGVPTIAVAFDRLQLRTADAFQERGAVLSAGLMDRLSPDALFRLVIEMIENRPLVQRLSDVGRMLVDGKGLSRVVEIVRRQLWLTSPAKTFTAC